MIEETRYRCEVCNMVHLNEADCIKCESMHMQRPEIQGMEYKRGARYPRSIVVRFENGREVLYSNVSIISTGEPDV